MVGTEKECAEKLGLQINTLRYYATPTRAKRMAKQKRNKYSGYLVLKLDDEEIEDNGIK
ncbi:MAG: hypothetical protein ACLUQ0_03315 [Enterococcus italicus]|uniref:hypothetical protein n=1 Tax=Enterococcus italicus TaxID=246144 RepID=UPI0039934216